MAECKGGSMINRQRTTARIFLALLLGYMGGFIASAVMEKIGG